MKGFNAKTSGYAYTVGCVAMFFAQLILTFVLGIFLAIGSANTGSSQVDIPESLVWVLLVGNQLVFLLTSVIFISKYKVSVVIEFGVKKVEKPLFIIFGIVFACALLFLMSPIMTWFIQGLEQIGYIPQQGSLPEINTVGNFILATICVAILPAICEEILFRGVILSGLKRCGKWFAILTSALMFMLMHQNIEQTFHQFILGVSLAYIAIETKSLIVPIVMHFLNNFIVVLFSFITSMSGAVASDALQVFDWIMFIVGGTIAITLAVIAIVREIKNRKKVQPQDVEEQNEAEKEAMLAGIVGAEGLERNPNTVATALEVRAKKSLTKKSVAFAFASIGLAFNLLMLIINIFVR